MLNSEGVQLKKAQVEFIVIFALIVVGVVVVLVAFQQGMITPTPPPDIQEEMKTIKDSVVNMVRTGTREKLELVYNQGGYLNTDNVNGVDYAPYKVPYWQMCDKTTIPDVKNEIRKGLVEYIKEKLANQTEFFGKNVSFDWGNFRAANVKVDIFKDKISVQVNLPTTVNGYPIQQPYEAEVETNINDVLEFSQNLAEYLKEQRIFENATKLMLIQSEFPPFGGQVEGCGKILYKTRSDVLPVAREVINHLLDFMPVNEEDTLIIKDNIFFPINEINGKKYPDIVARFHYVQEWDLNKHFSIYPDPLVVVPKPMTSTEAYLLIPMAPVSLCLGSYELFYDIQYPVIIRVKDKNSNQWFHFAVLVDIKDNLPGNCEGVAGATSEYTKTCIENAQCPVFIRVIDSKGKPIADAGILFDVCGLGETDADGILQSYAPCGQSELKVYKEGYKSYGEFLPAESLNGLNITLIKKQDNVTLHFNGVLMVPEGSWVNGTYGNYVVANRPALIDSFSSKLIVASSFSVAEPNVYTGEDFSLQFSNMNEDEELLNTFTTDGLFPNKYMVSSLIFNNDTQYAIGHMNYSFELKEDDKELYMYLPVVASAEYINETESGKLTDKLISCGIEPVSVNAQNATCV